MLEMFRHGIGHDPNLRQHTKSWMSKEAKRFIDGSVAVTALVVLSPLFFIVALLIALEGRGPILCRVQRCGYDGRKIEILKFRIAQTRICQALRQTKIEDLPAFLNVLKGDMSLVGPKPFPSSVGEHLHRARRHGACEDPMRLGLCGLWSLHAPLSVQEAIAYDRYYVEHWSLSLDLKIVARTLFSARTFSSSL